MKTEKTKVVFRKWKDNGDIIALFPEIEEGPIWCQSYMHVGQHGTAGYNHVIKGTVPATYKEYKELAKELRQIGYKLDIRKRR